MLEMARIFTIVGVNNPVVVVDETSSFSLGFLVGEEEDLSDDILDGRFNLSVSLERK